MGRRGATIRSLALGVPLVATASPARAGDVLDWATNIMSSCWSCDSLGQIVKVGLGFSEQAFTALAGQTVNLLGILMAIWLLFFAGRMFMPFGIEGGAGALWNKGAKKLLQFAVVLAFLQGSQAFWSYLFLPVMSSGMAFSKTIVTLSDAFEVASGTSETGPSGTNASAAQAYCSDNGSGGGEGVDGALAVMAQMNCPLATIQSQFGKGMLIGIAQVVGAIKQEHYLTALSSIIGGLLLIGVYFYGLLMFPIFLIDVLMRVTIMTTIAPLALAASLFEPTRSFAQKVVWQVAHAALTLVFTSIVGGIGKATLAYVFSNLKVDGAAAGARDWSTLIQILENQKTPEGADFYIDLRTMAFYQLLGVGVILIFMLRQANRMAAEFTGAGGSDFSGTLAGVAQGINGAAQLGGSSVRQVMRLGGGGRVSGGTMAGKVSGSGDGGTAGGA
ncbi:hypothetical protein [Telmatospirillum siberiense]|nr:hypothetical protein [Telmatospirillum siberiense]